MQVSHVQKQQLSKETQKTLTTKYCKKKTFECNLTALDGGLQDDIKDQEDKQNESKVNDQMVETETCVNFREELRQALGGEELLDGQVTTIDVVWETAKKVLHVSSRQRKKDKEIWWWNEYSISTGKYTEEEVADEVGQTER